MLYFAKIGHNKTTMQRVKVLSFIQILLICILAPINRTFLIRLVWEPMAVFALCLL